VTAPVDLAEALASFDDVFQPRIVGHYNGNKIVPRGAEHCPKADSETCILLIEPVGTPNTGDSTEREAAPERAL
jgi:hypothetical protein